MTTDYRKNYHLLGIEPGSDWKRVRRAYKKQVNLWHPDRFQHDPYRKKIAEEKTKEIIQCYQELAEYLKKYGVLPVPPADTAPNTAVSRAEPLNPAQDADASGGEIAESPTASPENPKSRMPKWRVRLIVAVTLLGAVYLIWWLDPSEHRGQGHPSADDGYAHQSQESVPNQDAAPNVAGFTIGSSLGEVYAIQGVPTRAENDTWYYGNSKVFFVDGKVVRWEESMETPLRVALMPGAARTDNRFFGHGSTKAEVQSAQGMPDRDAGSFWDYGASRVYFEGNRVSGWQEAPLYPLRIKE